MATTTSRAILTILTVTILSSVGLAQCNPGNVISFWYTCTCSGEEEQVYISACQGTGSGCNPLANHIGCINIEECWVFDAGSCGYSGAVTRNKGPILVAQLEDQPSVAAPASKPERCLGKAAFEAWLGRELTTRSSTRSRAGE